MRFTLASATVIALATSVHAVGNAIVKNNSTQPFYLWSVGGSVGDRQTVAPGELNHSGLYSMSWID